MPRRTVRTVAAHAVVNVVPGAALGVAPRSREHTTRLVAA